MIDMMTPDEMGLAPLESCNCSDCKQQLTYYRVLQVMNPDDWDPRLNKAPDIQVLARCDTDKCKSRNQVYQLTLGYAKEPVPDLFGATPATQVKKVPDLFG